ncbi:hypothetical protein SAMN05216308_101109 [Nitrosospira sp. Nsp13]|jgi:hypothetical protein|nr:hypothetical protein SAMN05216308_101109 [Nitrosospira sp. Nsp13]
MEANYQPGKLHHACLTPDSMDRRRMKATFGPYVVSAAKSLDRSERLVKTSYLRKGYSADHIMTSADMVFDAELCGMVVGTVMMRLDSTNGLYGDATYSHELDAIRLSGRKLAELCRFVIMPGQPTSAVMGALFHFVYVYSHLMNGVTDLICEVVPNHVAAQKRLLGFLQIAGPKPCERVGVDAVLLHRAFEIESS